MDTQPNVFCGSHVEVEGCVVVMVMTRTYVSMVTE